MEDIREAEARRNKKTVNPYATTGFFQKLLFTWMWPLFYKGYRQGLTEDDIYPHLLSHDSELLGEWLEREWNKELNRNKDHASLWRALARVFGKEMMVLGIGAWAYEMIRLTLPLTLAKLLKYFQPDTTMTINEAYMYAGIISATILIQITITHHNALHLSHMGMRLRVATVSLVYRKAIRLSKSSLAQTTVGQIVNLISNDVSRFETCTINVHNIWIGPIQLIVLLFLLYSSGGWIALIGIGILLCIIPFQIWMAKQSSIYRLRTAIKTDERIRVMNEIVGGVQVIKMYTWEKPFTKLVEMVRWLEMKEIKKSSMLKAIHVSLTVFLTKILIYPCVVVYVLLGNTLNAQYVFGLSIFYELLRQCLSQALAQGVTQLAEAIISARRIRDFLLYDEVEPEFAQIPIAAGKDINPEIQLFASPITDSSRPIGIFLSNVWTKWIQSDVDYSIKNIDFELTRGELATVIGKVGSGKSTLLHVILKELPPVTGSVKINGTISYASQEPWLFVGSARQNILFGQEFDVVKYHEVVRVCALERDFKLFPYGDRTIIGERGVSLSGGQRARINLARAIYKDADIYLLDDPLSAVDAHVGKKIFDECIDGYLKKKCVVLVTHQLQYLKGCKKIFMLKDGEVEHCGAYDDIKNLSKEFAVLMEGLKKMEDEEEVEEQNRTLSAYGDENVQLADPSFEKEAKIEGKVVWGMYKSYFLAGGNAFKILLMFIIFIFSQALSSSTDYFLSIWVNLEQMKNERKLTGKINDTLTDYLDTSEYSGFQKFWFGILTDQSCRLIYTGLVFTAAPLVLGRAIFFFSCCIKASINLHNNMFSKIVYAPMRFFNLNTSGRILNRFSKDMNMVDEFLPITMSDTLQFGLLMCGIMVVVVTVVPIILVPTGIMLLIFYLIRVVFVPTSRDIKRFEAINRSPMYSHMTASLQGLTTIRAFRAQNLVKKEFDNYQDAYSAAYFMFLGANRTFGFWLDLHSWMFVAAVTFSFLLLNIDTFGGSVGLAISQAITLSGWFQYCIRQWTEVENTMTSVERVKEYAEIMPETDSHAKEPPENWPHTGDLEFDNVCLRYVQDEPYVLKNLMFRIKSTEKVGIVGRTGAGKSSIVNALFRLTEIDGRILIDGVDTKTIPLNKLRSSISIIPQEPVLFSGALRKNLDPFDEYEDKILWNALEEVELKAAISELRHGLETVMSEGGSNFSVGQRQLVCLARAIVRKNKILVLDEATASVDHHTDGLIQTTIRKKFAGCTVLTIAHRLHTIMDSDKVLVMDAGNVVEFDHPYRLLQNQCGIFYSLVQQTGKAMAANLMDITAKAYQNRQSRSEKT